MLTKEELKLHQDARNCYTCGIIILPKLVKNKNYWKVRVHYHYTVKYRGAPHSTCNLKVIHNGSNYEYHFIIKELANEFERIFECLG